MKRIRLMMVMMAVMLIAGCSEQSPVTEEVETEILERPIIILKEKEEPEEVKVYGIGERVVVREDYAVTIIGVTETDEKIPGHYDPEAQSLLIEILFENLGMDANHIVHRLESSQSNGSDFYFGDGNMGINDYRYPYNHQVTNFTPMGTKSLQRHIYQSEIKSGRAKITFPDFMGEDVKFEIQVGEKVDADLSGDLSSFDDAYKVGDPMVLYKAKNDYIFTVSSVKKVEARNEWMNFDPGAVYEVELTISGLSLEKILNRRFDLTIVDENGNTGYLYYMRNEDYPIVEEDGKVRIIYYLATITDSDRIGLHCSEEYQAIEGGYYILADHVE